MRSTKPMGGHTRTEPRNDPTVHTGGSSDCSGLRRRADPRGSAGHYSAAGWLTTVLILTHMHAKQLLTFARRAIPTPVTIGPSFAASAFALHPGRAVRPPGHSRPLPTRLSWRRGPAAPLLGRHNVTNATTTARRAGHGHHLPGPGGHWTRSTHPGLAELGRWSAPTPRRALNCRVA